MSPKVQKIDLDPRTDEGIDTDAPDIKAFLRGGRTRTEDADPVLAAPPAPVQATPAPVAPPVAVPPVAPQPVATQAVVDEPVTERRRPRRPQVYPWQEPGMSDKSLITRTYRLPEKLVAKMEFAARRQGMTITAFLIQAIEREVAEVFEDEGLPND